MDSYHYGSTKRGLISPSRAGPLRAGPSTRHINPLGQAAAVLAFDVDNVGIAAAAAADAILLGGVKIFPVLVLLLSLPLVQRSLLQVRIAWQLACRRIGRAMLDCGMAVANVAEVVDVAGTEKRAGSKGVDGSITPLCSAMS